MKLGRLLAELDRHYGTVRGAGLTEMREEHSAERDAALRMRALRSARYDARMEAMLAIESYDWRFPGRGVC